MEAATVLAVCRVHQLIGDQGNVGVTAIDKRPADGPVKTAILGGNNARLYGYSPKMQSALQTDKVAYYKGLYEKHGSERTNLAYGYINKG